MNKKTVNIGKIENNPNYQFNSLPNSFDHNHWRQPSALIKILFSNFLGQAFSGGRQAFSTLSILNKDTYFLTHTSALRRIRWFMTARKILPESPPQYQFLISDFFPFFVHRVIPFFLTNKYGSNNVIFRKNNKGLTMSGIRPRGSPLDGKGSE